jgi:hypothetical protein
MRRMIHQHLLQRADIGPPVVAYLASAHLDEDALSAFVEGRLSDTESAPIIQHLVVCNPCRRFTAELVRLETEIGTGEVSASAPPSTEPGRIRSLLEKLAARVLPESDEVFAYHAPADDFERKAEAKDDEQATANEQSEQNDQTNRESE